MPYAEAARLNSAAARAQTEASRVFSRLWPEIGERLCGNPLAPGRGCRSRELISDERRWCKRSFAFTWLEIPVPVGSRYARRFCALGAIIRAGRELGLPVDDASRALEWQTVRPVIDWNDDKLRTRAEVVAAFDAAINGLAVMTPAA